MQQWLAVVLLKNAFGGSSDTTLKNIQDVLGGVADLSVFPSDSINRKLGIEPKFSNSEIDNLLATQYSSKYSYLILSLLYPERDWKDATYHEDHIFPKSEFTVARLEGRGYGAGVVTSYRAHFNTILNLQLLTDKENLEKKAQPFDDWLESRERQFKTRHSIPTLDSYHFDHFLEFVNERRKEIKGRLHGFVM